VTGGVYTLLFALPESTRVDVGALGPVEFPDGGYAYTGSAHGPGGFARVDRHRRVASGDHDVRHWHVDHLAGHPSTRLVDVYRTAGVDAECTVARSLPEGPVAGFGASDCDCRSHLATHASVDGLRALVEAAHG